MGDAVRSMVSTSELPPLKHRLKQLEIADGEPVQPYKLLLLNARDG